jgi:hypothetical protein
MIRHSLVVCLLLTCVSWAQITLHPSDNVPKIVSSKPAGTTFVFTPGTYRLSQPIIPKDNDKFIGQAACAPPQSTCQAVISGGLDIGKSAKPDAGNYSVSGQTQQNPRAVPRNCDPGWTSCMYPEDLFFDGVPYRHLDSESMPSIGAHEWWFDYANHVIYFHDDPSGHLVETSGVNSGFGGPANNVLIQYLTIEEFADMYPFGAVGGPQGKNSLTQGTNWTVENCEVKLNHGFGVRVEYRMHILKNYIHDNGQVGIGGGIGAAANPVTESTDSGILIEGNTISHNDFAHFNPGFGSGGIKVGATSGLSIRNNVIEHNDGAGIHFDADSGDEFVDNNVIFDNSDSDGLGQEIGDGRSVFRNNKVLLNGGHVNSDGWAYQIGVHASSGVEAYCNVMEVPPARGGIGGWGVIASSRGNSAYPPFGPHVTTDNYFHHNVVIWQEGANGEVGFRQTDPGNQPDFFSRNRAPDYNDYHLPDPSGPHFVYDNNNSRMNRPKNFSGHRSSGADVHGVVDKNYTSGFPEVSITYPADQSSVTSPTTVTASASDQSGIRKVEFYVDWKLETTTNNPPYEFNWTDGTSGSHIVAAMAYSNAGIRDCYAVTLNEQ